MEIAAVSTTAGDSDATVSALGWYGSWHDKGHGKGKNNERKEREKEKANVKDNRVTRKLNAINGKDDVRWNLVRWYRTRHILLSLTVDPDVHDDEDWPEEWCYDWENDWAEDWHDDWSWPNPEEHTSERHDDESSCLVCGAAASNPSLKQQNNEKVKLMIDGGSQSTACSVVFSKDYATDDSERAKL